MNKPDEEISFTEFLNYGPRVAEVADAIGANAPGVEEFPLLWYPLCNLNPAGQNELLYIYNQRDYDRSWKHWVELVEKIRSQGYDIFKDIKE